MRLEPFVSLGNKVRGHQFFDPRKSRANVVQRWRLSRIVGKALVGGFVEQIGERIVGAAYGKSSDIYKFEKIKRAKRQALADYPNRKLLDFGIGENDELADATIRASLKTEVDKIENRGYADNGIAAFKEAAANYMRHWFGVTLDPASEICHGIGSKPVYAMLPPC